MGSLLAEFPSIFGGNLARGLYDRSNIGKGDAMFLKKPDLSDHPQTVFYSTY